MRCVGRSRGVGRRLWHNRHAPGLALEGREGRRGRYILSLHLEAHTLRLWHWRHLEHRLLIHLHRLVCLRIAVVPRTSWASVVRLLGDRKHPSTRLLHILREKPTDRERRRSGIRRLEELHPRPRIVPKLPQRRTLRTKHHPHIFLLNHHAMLDTLKRRNVQRRHRRRPFRHTRRPRLSLTRHLHQPLVGCRHVCYRTTTDCDHLQVCVAIRHHDPRVRRATNLRQGCKTLPADESNVIRMNADRRAKPLEEAGCRCKCHFVLSLRSESFESLLSLSSE